MTAPAIRQVVRYALVTAAVVAAVVLERLMEQAIGTEMPFLILWPVIMLVARFGGVGPGLYATAVSVFAADWFLVAPREQFDLHQPSGLLWACVFVFFGAFISLLHEKLRRANQRIAEQARDAVCRQAELERIMAERGRLNAELQQRAEELAQADRHKNEFLATLGHELRSPLAAIRNAAHILGHQGPGEAGARQAVAIVQRQVDQIAHLVDDLTDISRISRGKLRLNREAVGVSAVLDLAVEMTLSLIHARSHELTVSPPPAPLRVHGDPARLAQVVANLLSNAAKYTESGGHIRLTAVQERDEVVIRVSDNGVGLPAEMLSRVFELYTQVRESLPRSQGGLGIGLALVQRLVEMHGGTVAAHSPGPGQGSTFVVRLPLLAAEARVPEAAAHHPEALPTH